MQVSVLESIDDMLLTDIRATAELSMPMRVHEPRSTFTLARDELCEVLVREKLNSYVTTMRQGPYPGRVDQNNCFGPSGSTKWPCGLVEPCRKVTPDFPSTLKRVFPLFCKALALRANVKMVQGDSWLLNEDATSFQHSHAVFTKLEAHNTDDMGGSGGIILRRIISQSAEQSP
jgi:hypothetical protein